VAGGRLIFSSLQENSDIWYLPLNADEAKVTGEPKRLTTSLTVEMNCAVSDDGSRVVYGSQRADGSDFVLHDLATGHTSIVASGVVPFPAPRISPDGSTVSYSTREAGRFRSFVIPASGGVPQTVCDDNCWARSWAGDGRRLVITRVDTGVTGLLDIATRQFRPLVHAFTSAPRTSRDDRWLTFYSGAELGRTKVYILPLHGEGEIPQSEWIEATDGSAVDVVP
jgi:Tol biopolymer transport system component